VHVGKEALCAGINVIEDVENNNKAIKEQQTARGIEG